MNYKILTFVIFIFPALVGCTITKPPPPVPPVSKPKPPYIWDEKKLQNEQGAPALTVDLSEQRIYFYKAESIIGESKCSSGKKNFETPVGIYKIIQRDKDHVSNLYGNFVDSENKVVKRDVDMSKMKVPEGQIFAGAKMPFFLRFHKGYGIHSGVVPNRPASHGCIRLPRIMAQRFFANSPLGTTVTVRE